MTKITVSEAQANLPQWLAAVSQRAEVAIATDDDLIQLRSIPTGTSEYAKREYGVNDEDLERYQERRERRYQQLKAEGKLIIGTPEVIRRKLDELSK